MPIYEYVCPVHGKFESLQKMGTEKVPCPLSPGCKGICKRVEWSVPGWRNPRYGEGEK